MFYVWYTWLTLNSYTGKVVPCERAKADQTREETIRQTTRAAKGYFAHKAENPLLSSQFAHPEYNEGAEHHAVEIAKDLKDRRRNLN